jgi:hypothetical protein
MSNRPKPLTVRRTLYLLRLVDKRTATHSWILDQVGDALAEHLRTLILKPRKKVAK